MGRIELILDVFTWAYRRSCARYSAIRQSLGQPDPFRLRYRDPIGDFVGQVVRNNMDKAEASRWIGSRVQSEIPSRDQEKFREVVETELGGLHEGNIARYRLRPLEFESWQNLWNY